MVKLRGGGASSSSAASELDVPLRQQKREQKQLSGVSSPGGRRGNNKNAAAPATAASSRSSASSRGGGRGFASIGALPSIPSSARHSRHRCVSDSAIIPDGTTAAAGSSSLQYRPYSPGTPPFILPVVGENDEGCPNDEVAVLEPPPSPGTPPRKLWERQFLRHRLMHPHRRQRSTSSTASSTASNSPAGAFLEPNNSDNHQHVRVMSNGLIPPVTSSPGSTSSKKSSSGEGSVRGGKFFASVFRSTSDTTGSHSPAGHKGNSTARRVKSVDNELDGTLRRGSEKAYTPQNRRYLAQPQASSTAAAPSAPPLYVSSSFQRPPPTTTRALDQSSSAMKKVFTDFHNSAGGDANSAYLGDDPSFRGHSLYWTSAAASVAAQTATATPNKHLQQQWVPQEGVPRSDSGSNDNKSTTIPTSKSAPRFSSLDTVQEGVQSLTRVLKQVVSVEAWQPGRRYLVAPAALAACPVTAVRTLLGASATTTVEQASRAITDGSASPFATIVLGECWLTYTHNHQQQKQPQKQPPPLHKPRPSSLREQQQWSSAILVLRQNYLLEYDADTTTNNVAAQPPRGYCHLQHATVSLHPDFQDCLELRFFGSPCAKADARVLMIRIVHPSALKRDDDDGSTEPASPSSSSLDKNKSGSSLDASAHHRQLAMVAREHWKTCLARAAALSKLSDLYVMDENDPATLLGTGQYAHVRAARRRRSCRRMGGTTESTPKTGDDDKEDDDDSRQYDCALKIFDKNKFWRMVVKGRERADTIVRETAVQATLAAQGGRVPSFLKIRGFFETSDSIVLELELLEGTDLFQYITSQNVLKETEAAVILRDILRSLDAMNRIGLAHRDVKPANILMCGEFGKKESLKDVNDDSGSTSATSRNKAVASSKGPRVKIGDFGMAAFVGVDGHIRGRCGTPGYVAPEIFSAGIYGGYGNKVDVFSAGVTLYVMLCGYEPFYGETDVELVEANKAAEIDFPVDDWGNVSPEAKDLVQQMMKADPTERLDARQALCHPWFSAQLEDGKPSDDDASWLDSRMSKPNEELVRMEGACIVS